jgi:hypothetical protein
VTEIAGKLLADLRLDGTVRMVFVAGEGTGDEPAFTVENLDTAEKEFVRTFGLTREHAAGLRGQLEHNKVFCVAVTLDDTIAPMFCRT